MKKQWELGQEFANVIMAYRTSHNMNHHSMARKLKISDGKTIKAWETGEVRPQDSSLNNILIRTGLDVRKFKRAPNETSWQSAADKFKG